jgi:hypothetical protein
MSNAYRHQCPGTLTHHLGISLDVAPITYAAGGFWLRTAAKILAYVQRETAHVNWCAISEKDHVHLSLSNRPAYGVNTPRGTVFIDPNTQQRLRLEKIMSSNIMLQDGPMGDILHGDLGGELTLTAGGDIGMGDLRLTAGGDVAMGDVGGVDSRVLNVAAESGDVRKRSNAMQALQSMSAGQKTAAQVELGLKRHRRSVTAPYILVSEGAEVRKSSIGVTARMSAAEAAVIRDDLLLIPQADPIATNVPLSGSDFVVNLSARYGAIFPTLVNEIPVRYVGSIIVITANALTYVPDIAANIIIAVGTKTLGATPFTISLTVQLAPGKNGSTRVYIPIATLSSARARLLRTFLFPDPAAVAPAATILTVNGIPTNYVVTHQFMFVEDSFTNKYTSVIPG